MKLSDFEDWKEILGTGKDFGDRNSFGGRKGLANLIRYSDHIGQEIMQNL